MPRHRRQLEKDLVVLTQQVSHLTQLLSGVGRRGEERERPRARGEEEFVKLYKRMGGALGRSRQMSGLMWDIYMQCVEQSEYGNEFVINQAALAREFQTSPASISRALRRMEALQVILRIPSMHQKRYALNASLVLQAKNGAQRQATIRQYARTIVEVPGQEQSHADVSRTVTRSPVAKETPENL